MKIGLLVFPGSNSEKDLEEILQKQYHAQVELLWHSQSFAIEHDAYFLPGGFSYGDYLRSGAMSARSQSMASLRLANEKQIPIIGICNGFQILTEAHFLPGALIKNKNLKHVCSWQELKIAEKWQKDFPQNYFLPVSHSEGNFLCSQDELKALQDQDRILFRYKENFNGSTDAIAGISNVAGNVIGLMPHPERAVYHSEEQHGKKKYGSYFFEKIFSLLSKP